MAKKSQQADPEQWRRKISVGIRFPIELIEELRSAIYHIGRGLTVNGIVEKATEQALERLRKEFNKGKPFPPVAEN